MNNGIFKKVLLEKIMRFRKSYIEKDMSQNGKTSMFKVDCFWVAYWVGRQDLISGILTLRMGKGLKWMEWKTLFKNIISVKWRGPKAVNKIGKGISEEVDFVKCP